MRLYVIGAEGQVRAGRCAKLRPAVTVSRWIRARPHVDLLHPASIVKAMADFQPGRGRQSGGLYRCRQS